MGTPRQRRTSTVTRTAGGGDASHIASSAIAPREKEFQQQIVDVARLTGWHVFHPYDSRRSTPGFPDLTLVRGAQIIFLEVKTETGKVTPEQALWIGWLKQAKYVAADVVRPHDWDEIQKVLRGPLR